MDGAPKTKAMTLKGGKEKMILKCTTNITVAEAMVETLNINFHKEDVNKFLTRRTVCTLWLDCHLKPNTD